MVRTWWALLIGLLLVSAGAASAAEAEGPAGTYRFSFQGQTYWLIKLEAKDGKWSGAVLATAQGIPPRAKLDEATVNGDSVSFSLKLQEQVLSFDGRLPKEKGKKVLGSLVLNNQTILAQLNPSQLKTLDRFEMSKEIMAQEDGATELATAATDLLREAGAKKAKPAEVRGWAEKAFKAGEPYGVRWQRDLAIRFARSLIGQEAFAPLALEQARRAERLLDARSPAATQMQVLELLATALRKAGREDEAKETQPRLAKLEAQDYLEYAKTMPPFKPDKFAGRKGKSDRVVLIELFTGAQCPPCVAADVAFDTLEKTYKPAEVVLLQYHLHIPGPDALTNGDTEARQKYYGRQIRGTPTIFFNGKAEAGGGGGLDAAEEKYKDYRDVIDPLLEKPAKLKLQVSAVRKGDQVEIAAKTADLQETGENIRLRLALVEEHVRYAGRNNLRYHHQVVRALPGGSDGKALTGKTGEHTAKVDLVSLRKSLGKYLDDFAKENDAEFSDRPMAFKNLKVVAFVQNDDNKEVFQAVQVAVASDAGAGEK